MDDNYIDDEIEELGKEDFLDQVPLDDEENDNMGASRAPQTMSTGFGKKAASLNINRSKRIYTYDSSSMLSDAKKEDVSDDTLDNYVDTSDVEEEISKDNGINKKELFKGIAKEGLAEAFKKAPLKVKLIIIGIIVGLIFLLLFIVCIIATLMTIGVIDISGMGGPSSNPSFNYTYISNSNSYWWPLGSDSTSVSGGKTFASGKPSWSTITSQFGPRVHPITGENSTHTGVDIANSKASGITNIIASRDGTVIYPGADDPISCPSSKGLDSCGGGYGNYVMIKHSDGNITLYAHMHEDTITVRSGDVVRQGQVIGKIGSSGNSTGPHLHFEIRVNGSAVNPLNFMSIDNPRPKSVSSNYVSGTSNKQSVCLSLRNAGFSNNAVAAILTNMNYESSFNPNVFGDNGTSYGLCQWHEGRYDNLVTTYPSTYHTIGSQVDFLVYELKNSYVGVFNSLSDSSKSYEDMTYDFCYNFERPYDTENTCQNRKTEASGFYTYVSNGCK